MTRERTKYMKKGKDHLPFEKWIFRSGQLDRDNGRRIVVAMIPI
jgi:hypothetical protein